MFNEDPTEKLLKEISELTAAYNKNIAERRNATKAIAECYTNGVSVDGQKRLVVALKKLVKEGEDIARQMKERNDRLFSLSHMSEKISEVVTDEGVIASAVKQESKPRVTNI